MLNVDKYGIWKGAVEQYLPLLLKRMMPELYEDADFTQGDCTQNCVLMEQIACNY